MISEAFLSYEKFLVYLADDQALAIRVSILFIHKMQKYRLVLSA